MMRLETIVRHGQDKQVAIIAISELILPITCRAAAASICHRYQYELRTANTDTTTTTKRGGTLLLWSTDPAYCLPLTATKPIVDPWGRGIGILFVGKGQRWFIVAQYGYPDIRTDALNANQWRQTWATIITKQRKQGAEIFVLGDQNGAVHPRDRVGKTTKGDRAVQAWAEQLDLHDSLRHADPNNHQTTHTSAGAGARIDYILTGRSSLHRAIQGGIDDDLQATLSTDHSTTWTVFAHQARPARTTTPRDTDRLAPILVKGATETTCAHIQGHPLRACRPDLWQYWPALMTTLATEGYRPQMFEPLRVSGDTAGEQAAEQLLITWITEERTRRGHTRQDQPRPVPDDPNLPPTLSQQEDRGWTRWPGQPPPRRRGDNDPCILAATQQWVAASLRSRGTANRGGEPGETREGHEGMWVTKATLHELRSTDSSSPDTKYKAIFGHCETQLVLTLAGDTQAALRTPPARWAARIAKWYGGVPRDIITVSAVALDETDEEAFTITVTVDERQEHHKGLGHAITKWGTPWNSSIPALDDHEDDHRGGLEYARGWAAYQAYLQRAAADLAKITPTADFTPHTDTAESIKLLTTMCRTAAASALGTRPQTTRTARRRPVATMEIILHRWQSALKRAIRGLNRHNRPRATRGRATRST